MIASRLSGLAPPLTKSRMRLDPERREPPDRGDRGDRFERGGDAHVRALLIRRHHGVGVSEQAGFM